MPPGTTGTKRHVRSAKLASCGLQNCSSRWLERGSAKILMHGVSSARHDDLTALRQWPSEWRHGRRAETQGEAKKVSEQFFERPILNSPYEYPSRHWELDDTGQPTQRILETRRRAEFITPIPKPKKRRGSPEQASLLFDEGKGLSTEAQRYDHTATINGVRQEVDRWRRIPNPSQWQVTPETARLLQHWRHHSPWGFSSWRRV